MMSTLLSLPLGHASPNVAAQKGEINNYWKAALPVMSYQEARDAPTEPIYTKRAPRSKIRISQTYGRSDALPPLQNPSNLYKITSLLCFRSPNPPPQQSGPLCLVISPPHTHTHAHTQSGQLCLV